MIASTRRTDLYCLLALLGVAFLLFAPYVLQPQVMLWPRTELGSDLLPLIWAPAQFLRETWQQTGEIPLWWGTSMSGVPLIGHPGMRLYYPPQLLLLLTPLPLSTVFALLNILHFWVAGLGAYGIGRVIFKASWRVALFGALAVMLTPRLSANVVGHMVYTMGLCWVPLCILLLRLALDRRSWRWSIGAGLSLGILYVLNFTVTMYLGLLLGLYGLFLCIEALSARSLRRILTYAGLGLLIGVVAIGIAAFELLPFLTFLSEQARQSMTLEDANHMALPLPLLINGIIPTPLKFAEWESYLGLVLIVLLPLSRFRRRETRLWLAVLIFGLLFSLGTATPLYSLIVRFVPAFNLVRVPARMLYIVALATAFLATLALQNLLENRPSLPRRWLVIGPALLIIITVAGRFLARIPGEFDWFLGIIASVGLIIAVVGLFRWQNRALLVALYVGLLLDLVPLDVAYMTPRSVREAFTVPPIAQALPPADDFFRIYDVRRVLGDHIAVDHQRYVVDGYNSFQFNRYSQFMRLATGCNLDGVAANVPPCAGNELGAEAYLDTVPDPRLLGLLQVRYIISPTELATDDVVQIAATDESYLYENMLALPRAFAVGQVNVLPDLPAVLAALPATDLQQTTLLTADPAIPPSGEDFFIPASITAYHPNRIDLTVDLPAAGFLILGEAWTPGWQARVDGASAPVQPVNAALRGVALPPGDHEIQFYFQPPAFMIGLLITLITGLGCLLSLIFLRSHQT